MTYLEIQLRRRQGIHSDPKDFCNYCYKTLLDTCHFRMNSWKYPLMDAVIVKQKVI